MIAFAGDYLAGASSSWSQGTAFALLLLAAAVYGRLWLFVSLREVVNLVHGSAARRKANAYLQVS